MYALASFLSRYFKHSPFKSTFSRYALLSYGASLSLSAAVFASSPLVDDVQPASAVYIPALTSHNANTERLILSLDGGGIRGVLEALVLTNLEETLEAEINQHFENAPSADVRLSECFDVIAGTSTGGIIALAMRVVDPVTHRPKYKMKELLKLYEEEGEVIFPTPKFLAGWLGSKFKAAPLEGLFAKYVGENTLKDLPKPTIITGYDIHQEGLYLFKSHEAHIASKNYKLKEVARATSAAPTYFPAAVLKSEDGSSHHFIDGGVTANNPTLHAYLEAQALYPTSKFHVLSLGTGSTRLFTLESKSAGGKLHWASEISEVLMSSSSRMIEQLTSQAVALKGDKYTRLQFNLDQKAGDLDKATPENIKMLKGYVKTELNKADSKFAELKSALLQFYARHQYYVYYPLIKDIQQQLQQKPTSISLACRHLTERGLWEAIHYLKASNIQLTHLDLRDNPLAAHSLGYLRQIPSLTELNLNNTNLNLAGLEELKNAQISLQVFKAEANPELLSLDATRLLFVLERYQQIALDPELHYQLGQHYERQGQTHKALSYYQPEVPLTQLARAKLYLRQEDTPQLFDEGFKLVKRLADSGHKDAQYTLGHFLASPDAAVLKYLQEQGIIEATDSNAGQSQSLYQAEHWYKLAANQKHKEAAKALGSLYERQRISVPIPRGQPTDERYQLREALKYYQLAAEAGSETAPRNIEKLKKRLQDFQ